MVLTPHMLVGAAIGSQVSNPWLAFCLGLFIHYLIDLLPHWDYLKKFEISNSKHISKVGLDLIIGGILVLLLTWSEPQKVIIILAAIFGSLLPDFANGIYMSYKFKWLKHHFLFHNKIHIYKELSFWQGLPFTLLVVIISFYILLL